MFAMSPYVLLWFVNFETVGRALLPDSNWRRAGVTVLLTSNDVGGLLIAMFDLSPDPFHLMNLQAGDRDDRQQG